MITVFQFGCWLYEKLVRFGMNVLYMCSDLFMNNDTALVIKLLLIVVMFKAVVFLVASSVTFFVYLVIGTIMVGSVQYPFLSTGYKETVSAQMNARATYYYDRFCLRSPRVCSKESMKNMGWTLREDGKYDVSEEDLEVSYDNRLQKLADRAEAINTHAEREMLARHEEKLK